ncbi:hypothetical protein EGM87_17405 [Sphingobium sp. RSMS]|uniref:hypothetical protein n=1 Tax=Sphingobium sp. RSMS TaxID=520734 RepID=UPI0010F7A825|nr:hypothetical protein [Sphingobium sp. RSMS]UXC90772.1 hypothetical protein EGM87_17405 [Sphingobium sp. RSMS]
MKRAPRSRQRHDLYAKYHDYDSEISDLLGECGIMDPEPFDWPPNGPAMADLARIGNRILPGSVPQGLERPWTIDRTGWGARG